MCFNALRLASLTSLILDGEETAGVVDAAGCDEPFVSAAGSAGLAVAVAGVSGRAASDITLKGIAWLSGLPEVSSAFRSPFSQTQERCRLPSPSKSVPEPRPVKACRSVESPRDCE